MSVKKFWHKIKENKQKQIQSNIFNGETDFNGTCCKFMKETLVVIV